jgi:hypothetical protein
MKTLNEDKIWPELPYRGLGYYRLREQALLAGRDQDIRDCSMLLAHPETRVLLLHGMTGCGKSSFLRAGLIPAVETLGASYEFLKGDDKEQEDIFIRCTEAPVDQIAQRIFKFAKEPLSRETPFGTSQTDLSRALMGRKNLRDYLNYIRNGDGLLESLHEISLRLPSTMVLIVDQAEEVLTLNPGAAGLENRLRFFRFLRSMQSDAFAVRIIVAFRTEYFGRFIDAADTGRGDTGILKHFLLDDLKEKALIEAILRPTLTEPVGRFGVPRETYKFSFEDNLPETITRDILTAKFAGASLPVLQLVCLGLYRDVILQQNRSIITHGDYRKKRGSKAKSYGT